MPYQPQGGTSKTNTQPMIASLKWFFFFSKHPVGSFVHCIVVMSCLLPPLFGPVVVFLVGKGRGGERKNEEEASDGLAWRFKEDFFSFPPSFSALVME